MIVFGHPTFFAALRTRLEAVFLHVVVVTVTSTMVSLRRADVVCLLVFAYWKPKTWLKLQFLYILYYMQGLSYLGIGTATLQA